MPWFKVDDKHHDHKKTRKVLRSAPGKRRDAAAMGLWELAGSWCADNLTDGFVPADELYRWDDDWEALAHRLVAADYWEPDEHDGEPGYRFINWEEHQPMKVEVEAKREAAKERMRNLRSGSRARSGEVRANNTSTFEGSSPVGSRTPSRPVPSRPDPQENHLAHSRSTTEDSLPGFDAFWDAYGKKVDRKKAEQKYRLALKKPSVTPDLLIAAAREYVTWERASNEGGRYIVDPARWLHGERWADERITRQQQPMTRVQSHLALAAQLAQETLPQIGGAS